MVNNNALSPRALRRSNPIESVSSFSFSQRASFMDKKVPSGHRPFIALYYCQSREYIL